MIFVTADLHLSHENIIKYCNRPFKNKDTMNNSIIKQYNSVVGPEDTCYILGDLSLNATKNELTRLISRLNGKKILIAGNHDNFSVNDYLNMGFESVHSTLKFSKNEILDGIKLPINIVMTHDPFLNYKRFSDTLYLCGHVHNMFKTLPINKTNSVIINVGIDVWNYKPQKLNDLIQINLENNTTMLHSLSEIIFKMILEYDQSFKDFKKNLSEKINNDLSTVPYKSPNFKDSNWYQYGKYDVNAFFEWCRKNNKKPEDVINKKLLEEKFIDKKYYK